MKNFKRFLVLCTVVGILVGFTAFNVAHATALNPNVNYTLAQLIAGEPWTIQDKVFTDFSYMGGDATSFIEGSVAYKDLSTGDIHGWLWTNTNPANANQWDSNFVLSYTISVASSYPNTFIIASSDQINDGLASGSNFAKLSDVQTGGTLNVNMLDSSTETKQIQYAPLTLVQTTSTATIPAGFFLTSYEQYFYEQVSSVPEPSMMLLVGFGLLGLAGVGRKFKK